MRSPKKDFFLFLPPQDISFMLIKLLNWVKICTIQKRTSFYFYLTKIFTSDNIHNDKITA